jgi:hypothetical protein
LETFAFQVLPEFVEHFRFRGVHFFLARARDIYERMRNCNF